MKKIILATCVAIVGMVLNAATCNWGVWGGVYEMGTSNVANDYLVYFFDNAAYSSAQARADLAAGDFSFLANGYQAEYLTVDGETEANDVGNFANGYTIDSYMVVFNADSVVNATYAYVSLDEERATGSTGANGQSAAIDFDDQTGMQTASNWVAVPEPTSGLMLLLGMAGLALRRRRA